MMGVHHALTGWCTGAAVAWAYTDSPTVRIGLGATTAFFSIFDDIDSPGSLISKMLPPVTTMLSWLVRRASKIAYKLTKTPKDRKAEGTHRYLTHTLVWAFGCGAVTGAVAVWQKVPVGLGTLISISVLLGCLTHLMGDDMTESGCPLFWPIKIHDQRWYRCHILPKWLRITTGTLEERVWIWLLFVPAAIVVIPGFLPGVTQIVASY